MRNKKYMEITIGGASYKNHAKLPILVTKTLDESLDFAQIELHHMTQAEPFKPFTRATIGTGASALSFVVASDEATAIHGTGVYKHSVSLIEQTKETERIMCGAKAFTNPLVRDYTDGQTFTYLRSYNQSDGGVFGKDLYKTETLMSPVTVGNLNIPLSDFMYGFDNGIIDGDRADITIYRGDSTPLIFNDDGTFKFDQTKYYAGGSFGIDDDVIFNLQESGVYIIKVEFGSYAAFRGLVAEIYVARKPVARDPYTVEDVVNILMDTSETIREDLDPPRYRLRYKSDRQREIFAKAAPEFRFSNGRSLWECLREVGQYVHAIPRAVHDLTDGLDYIEFDELGGLERADLSKGTRYGGASTVNVGDYTAGLEALAANLVNLDDEADGSMTEPFGGGYMSLRAATEEVRITEGTGIIKTANPVEKLLKVEVGSFTVGGKTYAGGDITPYIFEKSEYDILSGFSGAYPTSKTYALYYKQGAPNIEGLWYKAQDAAASALNAFEDYSITNIITAVTGAPSGILRGLDYPNLMFRVTYIPSVTARIRQYKTDYNGEFPSVLAHNQSANKLSARQFGENLRGQLAMMANTSDSVMYMFKRLEDVPNPGTLYDDNKYISSVTARVYHDFVLANIALSHGYNQLGARVEINNAIRQFEIPAAEDRYTVLEEFVEIGKKTSDDVNTAASSSLRNEVLRAFGSQSRGKDVSVALVTTYDEDGNAITADPVALPVISLALGTSLYFGWRFEDNFAAGSKSSPGASGYRVQDYVPYGDPYYAQARSVGFMLLTVLQAPESLSSAHGLPEVTETIGGTVMASTGDYPVLWHKDSADAGCLSYQLHYITNDGLIIGDGIAYHCAAVRSSHTASQARIYFYDRRINQITGTTDTENCVASFPITVDETYRRIQYDGSPTGFKSWAIIKYGRFMLGKNSTTPPNDIYFNFKRRSVK